MNGRLGPMCAEENIPMQQGKLEGIGQKLLTAQDNLLNVRVRLEKKLDVLYGGRPTEAKPEETPKPPAGYIGGLKMMADDLVKVSQQLQRLMCEMDEL